jgi:hypothetical protein
MNQMAVISSSTMMWHENDWWEYDLWAMINARLAEMRENGIIAIGSNEDEAIDFTWFYDEVLDVTWSAIAEPEMTWNDITLSVVASLNDDLEATLWSHTEISLDNLDVENLSTLTIAPEHDLSVDELLEIQVSFGDGSGSFVGMDGNLPTTTTTTTTLYEFCDWETEKADCDGLPLCLPTSWFYDGICDTGTLDGTSGNLSCYEEEAEGDCFVDTVNEDGACPEGQV